MGLPDGRKLLR